MRFIRATRAGNARRMRTPVRTSDFVHPDDDTRATIRSRQKRRILDLHPGWRVPEETVAMN